jgi:hypothetical protein
MQVLGLQFNFLDNAIQKMNDDQGISPIAGGLNLPLGGESPSTPDNRLLR